MIESWGFFLRERQMNFEKMLGEGMLKHLFEEHESVVRRDDKSNAFNVFEIISNLYYRENFHSDLIAFFLDPTQNHGLGKLGIELLINLISKQTGRRINLEYYHNAHVFREYGRIDILLRDDYSKHAIVIENKMNNAVDMDRQIPRYCNILESEGFSIDAAVYLPMLKYKTPDRSSWEERDLRWLPIIFIIPAVAGAQESSLTKDWIEPLAIQCGNEDVASILRQYSYLIKKISNYNMDKISFDKLYDYLKCEDHLDTANSFVSMMNDLPKYLAQRIFDLYASRCQPFTKVWIFRETDAVFEECVIDGIYFKMDIWCDTRTYNILFWAPSDKDVSKLAPFENIKDFLKTKGVSSLDDFEIADKYRLSRHFPISKPLDEIINPILDELRSLREW